MKYQCCIDRKWKYGIQRFEDPGEPWNFDQIFFFFSRKNVFHHINFFVKIVYSNKNQCKFPIHLNVLRMSSILNIKNKKKSNLGIVIPWPEVKIGIRELPTGHHESRRFGSNLAVPKIIQNFILLTKQLLRYFNSLVFHWIRFYERYSCFPIDVCRRNPNIFFCS